MSRLFRRLNGASVGLAAEQLGAATGRRVSSATLRRGLVEAVASESLQPMPGAVQLLSALAGDLGLAVASNGPTVVIDAVLQGSGLRGYFSHVVSAEDVGLPKPHPAVYLEACRRPSVQPDRAVALEDSPMGARAARAAGIHLVAVPSGETADLQAEVQVPTLSDPEVLAVFGLV